MKRRSYRRRTYRRKRAIRRPKRRINRRRRNFRRANGNPRRKGISKEYDLRPNFQGDTAWVKYKDIQTVNFDYNATPGQIGVFSNFPGNWLPGTDIPNLGEYRRRFNKARVVRSSIIATFQSTNQTLMRNVGISQVQSPTGFLPTPSATAPWSEQPRTTFAQLGALPSSRSVVKLKATGTLGTAMGTTQFHNAGNSPSEFGTWAYTATGATPNIVGTPPTYGWNWQVWLEDQFGSLNTPENRAGCRVIVTLYYTIQFAHRNSITN